MYDCGMNYTDHEINAKYYLGTMFSIYTVQRLRHDI